MKSAKFIDFLRHFADRKRFSLIFCQKKWQKVLKNRISARIYHNILQIWQKVLEFFAESRTCFQFWWGLDPPSPPQIGNPGYIIVVYPRRLFWQSIPVQGMLVVFSWIFCILSLVPWFLAGYSTYDANNQICLLPFRRSIYVIYNVSIVYLMPLCIIIFIYVNLVRYVHRMDSHNGSSTQTVFQARRELTVVKRIVTIISVLVIFGLPFTFFMFLSFVTTPSKYHYRFSLLSADLFQAVIMIGLFRCSQPVMDVLFKFRRRFSNIDQLSNKNSSAEK